MSWYSLVHCLKCPAGVLAPALLFFGPLPPQVLSVSPVMQVSLDLPPSPGGSAPGSTTGGGVRGTGASCVSQQGTPLIAVVPRTEAMAKEDSSTKPPPPVTISAQPTVFVHLPRTTAAKMEISVLDHMGETVYLRIFDVPQTLPGIKAFKLEVPGGLKVGQTYTWQLSLICDTSGDRTSDETVGGTIVRQVNEDLNQKVTQASTALEKATLYTREKIWYEAFSTAVEFRKTNQSEWNKLLTGSGLAALEKAEFLD